MHTCPDCGERVYNLGCVNCNEIAYIEEQERLTALYGDDDPEPAAVRTDPPSRPVVNPGYVSDEGDETEADFAVGTDPQEPR